MTAKSETINRPIGVTVTLGSSQYPSPLSITGSGSIEPGTYGAVGIDLPKNAAFGIIINQGDVSGAANATNNYGNALAGGDAIDLFSAGSLNNGGVIAGGAGGDSQENGGNGGIGVNVQANATIVNSGRILGGYGNYGFYNSGTGGAGIQLTTAATVSNSGTIEGGNGGRTNSYNVYAYRTITGGIGLITGAKAVVTNTGKIIGGTGGYTNQSRYNGYIVGNSGAAGASFGAGSTLTNSGTIAGGNGGNNGSSDQIQGGNGGAGLDLAGATASNSGLITGGSGEYGFLDGSNGGYGVYVNNAGAFTNTGKVTGGAGGISNVRYGGYGGIGLIVDSNATATNRGQITGGGGGTGGNEAGFGDGGLQGGYGAYVGAGILLNFDDITGGLGASTPGDITNNGTHHDNGGYGGAGLVLGGYGSAGAIPISVVNYGVVRGGDGGGIFSEEGTASPGGAGVLLNHGVFTNHGSIVGGNGGSVGKGSYSYIVAGIGGIGVGITAGTTLVNTGSIEGGAGGTDDDGGATGGTGIRITGGIFIDSGTVSGGKGGKGSPKGATGDAIYLGGSVAGTLVVDPGAVFTGDIAAVSGMGNALFVAGASSTALAGFGKEITGFDTIAFTAGATRTIEGTFAASAAILGFSAGDKIILDSFKATPAKSEILNGTLALTAGSKTDDLKLSLSLDKDLLIALDGKNTTITGASTAAQTIGKDVAQLVAASGTATNSFIETGGAGLIEQGGIAAHPTIAGGTLVLDTGASVTTGISFASGDGELIIDSTTMPSVPIAGFAAGDKIELAGVSFNKADIVTVGTAGYVTITGPGTMEILNIVNATKGETDFKFGNGSVLTRTTAQELQMTFLAADTASASTQSMPIMTWFDAFCAAEMKPMPVSGELPAELATLQNPGAALAHGLGASAFTMSAHSELGSLLGHPASVMI